MKFSPEELHESPITWEKQLAQCEYYHRNPDHMCGATVYKSLPAYVMEHLACHCDKDYRQDIATIGTKGIRSFGTFCLLCGKPHIFSIHRLYYRCEGCDKLFTYDFRELPNRKWNDWITWPPENLLCKECDVSVTVINRTGGIVFG